MNDLSVGNSKEHCSWSREEEATSGGGYLLIESQGGIITEGVFLTDFPSAKEKVSFLYSDAKC